MKKYSLSLSVFKCVIKETSAKKQVDLTAWKMFSMEVLGWNHRGWFELVKIQADRLKRSSNNGNTRYEAREKIAAMDSGVTAQLPQGTFIPNEKYHSYHKGICLKFKAVNESLEITTTKKNIFRLELAWRCSHRDLPDMLTAMLHLYLLL